MAWQRQIKTRWAALGLREQRGLQLAAVVLAAGLVWSVGLAPALRTLRGADAQSVALARQVERMQALQQRAQALQAKPAAAPQDTLKALQSATVALGKGATLQVAGTQATITLVQVSAPDLAPWLSGSAAAGQSPAEAHLQRSANEARWSGTLLYRLPSPTPGAP